MSVVQISLWDNEALERGYRCLSRLELGEAVRCFKLALQSGIGSEDAIRDAVDACHYWQLRIRNTEEINADTITDLTADYKQYSFSPLLKGLKTAVIGYIMDSMLRQPEPVVIEAKENQMQVVFDLLLEVEDFQKAEDFITVLMSRNKEKWILLYFLAQAQWLNGNKSASNEQYILALLHHPDEAFISRVENKKLRSVIQSYGPAMAPAYCLLLEGAPVVPVVNNIKFLDEEHARAIKSLNILREANKALKNNNLKMAIKLRKQLKAENPALFEVYFNALKRGR